jgi:hypothetical protein
VQVVRLLKKMVTISFHRPVLLVVFGVAVINQDVLFNALKSSPVTGLNWPRGWIEV